MINYKDKTFCSGGNPRCTAFKGCPRALTDEVKAGAMRWWEGNEGDAPISQFAEPLKNECYELPQKTGFGGSQQ